MNQLLLHLLGDYIIQNDWMALNKKEKSLKGEIACQIHCVSYSLPFLLICSWWAVAFIYATHYIIDRTNIIGWFLAMRNGVFHTRNFGFSEGRPQLVTVWLYIITDNVFHVFCNWFAAGYL